METISADYLVSRPPAEAKALARYVAYEQTVELPEDAALPQNVRDEIVGQVDAVEPAPGQPGASVITLSFNVRLSGLRLAQFLNLVYGNISIQKGIRLIDLRLPDSFLKAFPGPAHGMQGVRKILGVEGRPLLATAIKPMGAPHKVLADIAGQFALGGGDIVKDDQNLVDDSEDAFRDRVALCQEAVAKANAKTGRSTLYLPIVTARQEDVEARVAFALEQGARGILFCPFLSGIDAMRHLSAKYKLVMMSHPSFSGAFFSDSRHGVTPGILLGSLMRLAGADVSIFPNFGGRFSFTREECMDLSRRLRGPWGRLKPSFPSPAGGMRFESLPSMSEDYGEDTVFLIGGALLGKERTVEKSTRAFLDQIRSRFQETLCKPA
ncbi:MAG: ribulose 1,5-bisphosphate carboxylase [Elusimicrobia bacterium]|nr:ribulose 1,5-bisphosphate carboxylase [Elusimicrobiota bacterium]